jgi:hypothetical protein
VRTNVKDVGSSSLLVMIFDRTCGFETVYRNSDRKMPQPPNGPPHKGIQSPFTKSDEEPGCCDAHCTGERGGPALLPFFLQTASRFC